MLIFSLVVVGGEVYQVVFSPLAVLQVFVALVLVVVSGGGGGGAGDGEGGVGAGPLLQQGLLLA